MKFYAFLFSFLFTLTVHAQTEETHVTVAHVIDGDTFVTTQGEHIRLLGINAPEKARKQSPAQPFGKAATVYAQKLLKDKNLTLTFGPHKRDRYKRLLAHATLADGTWVNGHMVEAGMAHVYSFPDNRPRTGALIAKENTARQNKKGLWSHPRWQVRAATDIFPEETIGQFHLIEGTVTHTARVKGITYLNFGEDWRTDFTVEIRKKDLPLFTEAGITPHQDYQGKRLRVRGMLKPVNGILVTATHPEQLEILTPSQNP